MKALVLESAKTLSLREVPLPATSSNDLLISVELASIGGSEYMAFNSPGLRSLPHIMGHGIAGMTPGDKRVAVYPLRSCLTCAYCQAGLMQLCDKWSLIGVHSDGGFAQSVTVPKANLVDIPDTLSWEQTAFIEPFANAVNAWELAQAKPEDKIAVIGTGGLGLGLVALASSYCGEVTAFDLSASRREIASELGASFVAPHLNGQFDVVFETFGSVKSRTQGVQLTKKGGKCVFMGFASQTLELDMSELIRQQKRLLGSFVYSRKQFCQAMKLAALCSPEWVTNVCFSEVEPLLRSYLKSDFGVVKAALRPQYAS